MSVLKTNPSLLNRQLGFSLIELMIAIGLSVVMMAGVTQVMLGTKRTFTANIEHSQVQENARIALDLILVGVRNAGFSGGWNAGMWLNNTRAILGKERGVAFTCGGVQCSQDEMAASNGFRSDSFAVMMISLNDGSSTDCTGAAIPAVTLYANRYWVADSNGVNALFCQGFTDPTSGVGFSGTPSTAWVATAGGAQPLVDGIESLQVLYGVDQRIGAPGSNLPSQVDLYESYNAVSNNEWDAVSLIPGVSYGRVSALRISILANNGQARGFLDPRLRSYQLGSGAQVDITDDHLRQIYSTTISLPNARIAFKK